MLYFGCRSSEHDDIYKSETREAEKGGGLSKVHTAFSREPNLPKVIELHVFSQAKISSGHI